MLSINKTIIPKRSGKTSKGSFIDYTEFDKYKRKKGGETIERNINWYRVWFQYLKLCLEVEKKKIEVNGKLLRVDRKFYREWDISEILDTTFDSWWKKHRELFVLEQVEVVKSYDVHLGNIHDDNDEYMYLKVPKHRNESELLSELSDVVKGKFKGNNASYPFTANSRVPYLSLHIEYNCLVLYLNGKKGTQILDWVNEKYKHVETPYTLRGEEVIGHEQSVSRILVKGRKRLEETCLGNYP